MSSKCCLFETTPAGPDGAVVRTSVLAGLAGLAGLTGMAGLAGMAGVAGMAGMAGMAGVAGVARTPVLAGLAGRAGCFAWASWANRAGILLCLAGSFACCFRLASFALFLATWFLNALNAELIVDDTAARLVYFFYRKTLYTSWNRLSNICAMCSKKSWLLAPGFEPGLW